MFSDLNEAGVDYLRLGINPLVMTALGLSKMQFLFWVEDKINELYIPLMEQYGMAGILGVENMPYDLQECSSKINDGYWTNNACIQDFRDTAFFLAHAFHSVPKNTIFAYQFMSEPVGDGIGTTDRHPDIWYELSEELIDIVRQYDTEKFIVWSRGIWGISSNYYKTVPFDDNKVIYNFHNFAPQSYTHQGIRGFPMPVAYPGPDAMDNRINAAVAFRDRNNGIPIMVGSYSVSVWITDRTDWLQDALDRYRTHGISSINFTTGVSYKGWDLRYTSTYAGPDTPANYVYDKTNPAWQMISGYWLGN